MPEESIADRFRSHPMDDGQGDASLMLRCMFTSLAEALAEECPQSRELSLAMTKLEEAMFWTTACIARNKK